MMDKLKYIKIEDENGSLSDSIPIGADAKNIDTESNSTVEAELNSLKTKDINQDNLISDLQDQIKSLASGSPLVANNVNEMTDTSRIYVNTTDGHWYFFNGRSWADGGVYQATEIEDGSITKEKLSNEVVSSIYEVIGTENLYDKNETNTAKLAPNLSGNTIVGGVSSTAFILPINKNSTITIEKISSARFTWCTSTDFPIDGVTYNQVRAAGAVTKQTITSGANDNYLLVVYYLPSQDTTITKEEIEASIKVYYGEEWVEAVTKSENLQKQIDNIAVDVINSTDNMINLLSYKPLGTLTKGYIALSCDDGGNALATYTIPRLKYFKTLYNKNIPVTFGLMTDSQVFQNDTYKALVQEMVADYGCEVAIHGGTSYLSYTLNELKEFLDTQKTQLTSLCNEEPKSIIYPNHDYNIKTSTLAGSYFGVCCTGGVNKPIKYLFDTAGPRSNMYTLYRMSLLNSSVTKEKIKNMLDYVKDNNLITLPFWHDNSLNTDEKKELLDYIVQYGVQIGLNFITVSDIKNII